MPLEKDNDAERQARIDALLRRLKEAQAGNQRRVREQQRRAEQPQRERDPLDRDDG